MKQEEEEAKAREREANMTPEEKMAEKIRLQKIQEEADLRAAMDTFGVTEGIDGQQPKNKAELTELADSISKKVSQFKHLADFPGFLEDLVRNVCANREYFPPRNPQFSRSSWIDRNPPSGGSLSHKFIVSSCMCTSEL